MNYKIHINNRNYETWNLYNIKTMEKIDNEKIENEKIENEKIENEKINISPIKEKLFHNDIFTFNGNKVKILESTTRKNKIAGVLVLKNNKTFGKFKNKYFYKCIPDDNSIPEFLIPYKPQIKFIKNQVNKYIVFRFINWNNKHPRGQIQQTIGDVTELPCFYEYQIYCKNLYHSIAKFKKKTKEKLKQHSEEYYTKLIMDNTIENRLDYENIITIAEVVNVAVMGRACRSSLQHPWPACVAKESGPPAFATGFEFSQVAILGQKTWPTRNQFPAFVA